ncbi:protein lifeguard 1-like [Paramacrobiotus metropolitanus]|uniref:protein lifeguard 1-like n=1 Tax=Paramacrobiotus metropolitanus TaxID=2943436 RepID=UPI0024459627|nr:protein lifeguard 1-like [Paramacrobiotus metropolitanus]XP_055341694.1 protein lifeguard 1-like [Paramacrobiotus metropolitanus]
MGEKMEPMMTDGRDYDVETGNPKAHYSFDETSIRAAFVRKVFGIVSVLLLITTGFIALFMFIPELHYFAATNQPMMIASMVLTFVIIIALACFQQLRRQTPVNFILLILFTLCMSWMLATVTAFYEVESVLWAAGVTAVITIALTIFAMQTKWDFTIISGLMLVVMVVLLFFGIFAAIFQSRILHVTYAALGALVFGIYLVIDVQLMLGGQHTYSVSPEEYVFAALNIYLDIVNLFLKILIIIGNTKK